MVLAGSAFFRARTCGDRIDDRRHVDDVCQADQPGWASIIPFYNIYIMLKIVGRPGWWLILFIPFVHYCRHHRVHRVGSSFGTGVAFAIGLYFLPFIFWLILGFGEDRYLGPAGAGAGAQ